MLLIYFAFVGSSDCINVNTAYTRALNVTFVTFARCEVFL